MDTTAEKLSIGEMIPKKLTEVNQEELLSLNHRLHQLFGMHFAGNDKTTIGDLNREDVINAALFVWSEMKRRKLEVSEDTDLWNAAQHLIEKSGGPREYFFAVLSEIDGICQRIVNIDAIEEEIDHI